MPVTPAVTSGKWIQVCEIERGTFASSKASVRRTEVCKSQRSSESEQGAGSSSKRWYRSAFPLPTSAVISRRWVVKCWAGYPRAVFYWLQKYIFFLICRISLLLIHKVAPTTTSLSSEFCLSFLSLFHLDCKGILFLKKH